MNHDSDDDDTYLLLLLSDSNLPTGSFVASSGFESYIKHGFGLESYSNPSTEHGGARSSSSSSSRTTTFLRESIAAYARNALAFMTDAHISVERFRVQSRRFDRAGVPLGKGEREGNFGEECEQDEEAETETECLQKLKELDALYDAMTLNHVTKRASKAQGVALLTLYAKAFSAPLPSIGVDKMASLVAKYKSLVRAETAPGHLPICWGILSGALGLTLERAQYLHIYLHARSLLSAAVRLNEIGPYHAQQILLYFAREVIRVEVERCRGMRTGLGLGKQEQEKEEQEDEEAVILNGPANIWPLGEMLAARHDLQHSRIFNS